MGDVCVHGLGYIGLPTAAMLANHDHKVFGYDPDVDLITDLQSMDVQFDEPGLDAFVTRALKSDQLQVSNRVVPTEFHVICVPTPFDEATKSIDLDYVREAGKQVAETLREGDTVILESTVPPGTTTNELTPILERSGLVASEEFGIVHCPETVLPGNIITEMRENDRILGGIDKSCAGDAADLYRTFVEGDIHVTRNPTTAEFVKLIQNTFRDTNVALANELAKIARDYDIDSRHAIELANRHPRVDLLQPGPGVGGHCLPVDPWFLGHDSDELDLVARARHVNDGMVDYIVDLLEEELDSLSGTKIAILGVTYKGDVSDTRMSPGLALARTLQERDGEAESRQSDEPRESPAVSLHDPRVDDQILDLVDLDTALTGADGVVITTDHSEYYDLDLDRIRELGDAPCILDTKAVLDRDAIDRSASDVLTL